MIEALITGTKDTGVLSKLAKGRLEAKLPELKEALEGYFREHHAFLVRQILGHIDYLEDAIEQITKRIDEQIAPFASRQVENLKTIPGVGKRTAEVIVSEIGKDMKQFPSAGHLASWAGICPGNNQSAGKHRSGRTRKGNRYLRPALVEAALAATRSNDNYLSAQYRRIVPRRGHKRTTIAVAHSILVVAYPFQGSKLQRTGERFL